MLIFLFWIQKNKLKMINKLNNHANPQLDPIEKFMTKLLNDWNVELNQATKIMTVNPRDIHNKDLDNNFDFISIAWILYFEKKLLDIFSISILLIS